MPGKQMAIDADLNAGLIGEDEARRRRAEVSQESDFFGSMDGASKFVRGDAIAGLLIMAINIIGGLIVGVAQHDMSMSDSAHPGAGDLDRRWRGRVPRVDRPGHRPADHQPAVLEPRRAVPDGWHHRHHGPDPQHAAHRLPVVGWRAGLGRLDAAQAPAEGGAGRRADSAASGHAGPGRGRRGELG
ncbi:hypothetical protein G6F68_013385 [Rhizopus microsporus]|nr:hypothetical protein G6F68_013385 [Rhizopus microsporus]